MPCAAENCNRTIYCRGYCQRHYQRINMYGRLNKLYDGDKYKHPFYNMWWERKNENKLCEAWLDFWEFVKGIGERPKDTKLRRIDIFRLYGPDNFKWANDTLSKDGETKNQQQARRRRERPDVYKSYELKSHFKITYEEYLQILEKQNGVCAICEEKEKVIHHVSGELKSLAVDHDHITGKIRGLLCQRCNRVLGKVRDSINLLDKMKAYINANS